MIYAALSWPEHNKRDLSPLALTHAVHIHNEFPSMDSRLTPTRSGRDQNDLTVHWCLTILGDVQCTSFILVFRMEKRFQSGSLDLDRVSTWESPHYTLVPWDSFEIFGHTILVLNSCGL